MKSGKPGSWEEVGHLINMWTTTLNQLLKNYFILGLVGLAAVNTGTCTLPSVTQEPVPVEHVRVP
jgi:hypothetical protein